MRHRSRRFAFVALLATVLASAPSSGADEAPPVPGSCKPHDHFVVNRGCVAAATSELRDPGTTLPNLVPDVGYTNIIRPFTYNPETGRFVPGAPELWFDTKAQNLGTVPVQITVDEVESPEASSVSQCVSWTERVCRRQVPVGGYTWHEEHTHFHFEEFATYELRRLGSDGRADYSAAGLITRSDKVSFCMIDSERVREDAFVAPVYLTCLPTVQGISPGWTDIYGSSLEGQQLPLDGLEDGRYALIITIDYGNRLLETDDTDNVVEATIELSDGLQTVQVVDRHYPTS